MHFDVGVATLLTDISRTHSLRRLKITTLPYVVTEAELSALGDALGTHVDLQYLSLSLLEAKILDPRFLQSVRGCTALQALHLFISARDLQVNDGQIGNLLRHLPRLLNLSIWLTEGGSPKLTLDVLVYALTCCEHMNSVAIAVDATLGPTITCAPHTSWNELGVPFSISQIGSPFNVATFLTQLSALPLRLTNVKWKNPPWEPSTREKENVKQRLEVGRELPRLHTAQQLVRSIGASVSGSSPRRTSTQRRAPSCPRVSV